MKSNNAEIYKETFISSLSIDQKNFSEDLKYNEIEEWDSIGHMALMAELETSFGITIKTEDLIEFESYKQGVDILKRYDIIVAI